MNNNKIKENEKNNQNKFNKFNKLDNYIKTLKNENE